MCYTQNNMTEPTYHRCQVQFKSRSFSFEIWDFKIITWAPWKKINKTTQFHQVSTQTLVYSKEKPTVRNTSVWKCLAKRRRARYSKLAALFIQLQSVQQQDFRLFKVQMWKKQATKYQFGQNPKIWFFLLFSRMHQQVLSRHFWNSFWIKKKSTRPQEQTKKLQIYSGLSFCACWQCFVVFR